MANLDNDFGKVYKVVERIIDNQRVIDGEISEISRKYIDKLIQTNWDDGFTLVLPNEIQNIFPTREQAENCLDMLCHEIAQSPSVSLN